MAQFKGALKSYTLADSTTVAVPLSYLSKEHMLRLDDPAVDWTFGFDEATVTAGDGFPMVAGEVHTIDSPVASSVVLYVRQESGGPVNMRHTYLYPNSR